MKKAELELLPLPRLQAMCFAAGLDGSGNKEELINRLLGKEKPESKPASE